NNFYTATVYEKGAEVIRMQHRLLGAANFRKGMDLYFQRHDGQAVTCDDFVAAMEDASGQDLTQFKLWYSQAGTPAVEAKGAYNDRERTYALTLTQSLAPTPGQAVKEPMHIPFAVGLVDHDGRDIALELGDDGVSTPTKVLELRQPSETFIFRNVPSQPLPSLNRGFSAPVNVTVKLSDNDRAFLMAHDSDGFNRWQAKQDYAAAVILRGVAELNAGRSFVIPADFLNAMGAIAADDGIEDGFRALLMAMPGFDDLANRMSVVDPLNLFTAREAVRRAIAEKHFTTLQKVYEARRSNVPFSPDAAGAARRSLKNTALSYLALMETDETTRMVKAQFDDADNMTDRMSALSILSRLDHPARAQALHAFAARYDGDAVVLDKWLAVQATSPLPDTPTTVRNLLTHKNYDAKNPNRIRSLVGAFSTSNPVHFHATDGSGYAFLADQIIAVDKFNPQTAARMLPPLGQWRRYDQDRQKMMKAALKKIADVEGLSRDVFELATKSLGP
ncbi:MAG: DUF3458 domain-containing protein, partial [Rhodobacteraceae bacterium]|nr:DUF3458 domain-containing protein [Paracoccaceae bacterium]